MLLLDNSAWARHAHPEVRESFAVAMESAELRVCLPFLLEAGYSARSGADHADIVGRLALLPRVEITGAIERLALSAQGELARVGHHRIPPTDVLIAACAQESGAGVLHYDHDYDLLAEHTSLSFKSEWLAAPGTL